MRITRRKQSQKTFRCINWIEQSREHTLSGISLKLKKELSQIRSSSIFCAFFFNIVKRQNLYLSSVFFYLFKRWKLMEIVYQHKPFSKNYNKPLDHFLFLLAVLSYRYNLARFTTLFLRGDLRCKQVVLFILRTEF